MAEFLFEIGLEEIPARMIASAEAELTRRVVALLERERLMQGGQAGVHGEVSALTEKLAGLAAVSYSTPRRLAVLVRGVLFRQQDVTEEMLGPAVKIAFPKGRDAGPGPAALAFARKAGIDPAALRVVDTPKGEYLAATSTKPGRSAAEILTAELPKEFAAIYWSKTMYWRPGKPERFVRPVRWMTALLDQQIVPVEFGGKTAGAVTFGHRVLFGDAPIEIPEPAAYASVLSGASVMVEAEGRRHTIRKALDRVCRTVPETRWREDHALVDKLTHLTEWPSVLLGSFDPAYLDLPEEVLVTVMRDHQNYFAVEDAAGRLAPYFLAVLNTATDAAGEAVIRHGNERVLRARFNDARFFWEFDQRIPLADRLPLLEKVTFQKDLGSYAAKTERMRAVAGRLAVLAAGRGTSLDVNAADQAASLAKADLTAELVKEFTELQGEIGGLYARRQGFPEAVAAAIYDQYRPAGAEDRIPRTPEGQVLAMADKLDTIAGMFGLGMEPTGSRDPFALRRAANGVVRILAEGGLGLGLGEALSTSGAEGDTADKVRLFFTERVSFYLREGRNQAYDVVAAVMAAGFDDLPDTVARAEAVTAMRGSEDFLAVAAALKRIRNILQQAGDKGFRVGQDTSALVEPAEIALREHMVSSAEALERLCAERKYAAALELIATFRPRVDAFFDQVMILVDDKAVRAARLALLQELTSRFGRIADFSEVVLSR